MLRITVLLCCIVFGNSIVIRKSSFVKFESMLQPKKFAAICGEKDDHLAPVYLASVGTTFTFSLDGNRNPLSTVGLTTIYNSDNKQAMDECGGARGCGQGHLGNADCGSANKSHILSKNVRIEFDDLVRIKTYYGWWCVCSNSTAGSAQFESCSHPSSYVHLATHYTRGICDWKVIQASPDCIGKWEPSVCKGDCGTGIQILSYKITHPMAYGGKVCPFVEGATKTGTCLTSVPCAIGIAGSSILDTNQANKLQAALRSSSRSNGCWTCCYSGAVDGWSSATFHKKCDNVPHTVTIARVGSGAGAEIGRVFGGYTPLRWTSSGEYKSTPNGWLFRFSPNFQIASIAKNEFAIFDSPSLCPTFGGGQHDLMLTKNCDRGNTVQHSYLLPQKLWLTGCYSCWILDQLEVYHLGGNCYGPNDFGIPFNLADHPVVPFASAGMRITGSKILNPLQAKDLGVAVEPHVGVECWTCCYRAAEDGWSSLKFHQQCDNKANTLTIGRIGTGGAKAAVGRIIGGFSPLAWTSSGGYKSSATGWLFRFTSKGLEKASLFRSNLAIYDDASYCPTFGGGHDLMLGRHCYRGYALQQSFSYSSDFWLTGCYNCWQLDSLEVFHLGGKCADGTAHTETKEEL